MALLAKQLSRSSGFVARCMISALWNRRNAALNNTAFNRLSLEPTARVGFYINRNIVLYVKKFTYRTPSPTVDIYQRHSFFCLFINWFIYDLLMFGDPPPADWPSPCIVSRETSIHNNSFYFVSFLSRNRFNFCT